MLLARQGGAQTLPLQHSQFIDEIRRHFPRVIDRGRNVQGMDAGHRYVQDQNESHIQAECCPTTPFCYITSTKMYTLVYNDL